MNRRVAMQALAVAAVGPLIAFLSAAENARAQSAGKVHRVALIMTTSPPVELAAPHPVHPGVRAFLESMRERGYVEGHNWMFDPRSAEGHWERTTDIMADLARLKTDVVVVATTDIASRAIKVTRAIPIVVLNGHDIVRMGLARSLARPGGSVTGTTLDVDEGAQVKRLDLLLALLPKTRRIAFIGTKDDWSNPWGTALRSAATTRGVQVFHAENTDASYESAFSIVRREKPDAFWIPPSSTAYAYRAAISQFSRQSGLPGACPTADFSELGCLMSYGFIFNDVFIRAAGYVDKILKGAKAGELPIEQPSRFEFAVNLRTARQIGLAIPTSVLMRADRVIE